MQRVLVSALTLLLACRGTTRSPDDARLEAPGDADADYPPTCAELGPATCQGPCGAGDPAACLHLAEGYVEGVGVEADPQRGIALMRKACDAGFGRACAYLAAAIGDQDRAEAVELARRGCEGGYGGGCIWYVSHRILAGEGAPDWRGAAPWLERGCNAGYAKSCVLFGDLLRTGMGVASDPGRAHDLYARACDGGQKLACRLAQDLTETPGDLLHVIASPDPSAAALAETREHFSGKLRVDFCVDTDGSVEAKRPSGAPPRLAALAQDTVAHWQFAPTGLPDPFCTSVAFELVLR